jgi:type I restriction enzyme M protein
MKDIEDDNPSFKGALPQRFYVPLNIPKENFKGLIDEVSKIDESRFSDEDLIGRVYEYFSQAYAVAGDKEDGEFYTPACAVKLIAELIEPYSDVVHDPCVIVFRMLLIVALQELQLMKRLPFSAMWSIATR